MLIWYTPKTVHIEENIDNICREYIKTMHLHTMKLKDCSLTINTGLNKRSVLRKTAYVKGIRNVQIYSISQK